MSTITTATRPKILADLGFVILSPGISLFEPGKTTTIDGSMKSPTLIVLCSWAFAQPKPISKYIQPYQGMYPSASILLVQNAIANPVWKPDSWQMNFFQSAAAAIQAHLSVVSDPLVLVHVFSNGGSHAAVQLSQACREICGGMRMPCDALILDSCPGQPRTVPTIKALIQGIPSRNPIFRGLGTVAAWASVGGTALMDVLNLAEPAAWKLYRLLNDPYDVFLIKQSSDHDCVKPISRAYIYSTTDIMIMGEDVLGHARIAKERLSVLGIEDSAINKSVRVEEFIGTDHVNHVKGDAQRYWNIIGETWDSAVRR